MHGRAVITGVSSERRSGRSSYSEHAGGRARIESDVADGIVTSWPRHSAQAMATASDARYGGARAGRRNGDGPPHTEFRARRWHR
jgi:hypothetical protein